MYISTLTSVLQHVMESLPLTMLYDVMVWQFKVILPIEQASLPLRYNSSTASEFYYINKVNICKIIILLLFIYLAIVFSISLRQCLCFVSIKHQIKRIYLRAFVCNYF